MALKPWMKGRYTNILRNYLSRAIIGQAILESVPETGFIPNGHVYAAVMQHMSLDQYTRFLENASSHHALRVSKTQLRRGSEYGVALARLAALRDKLETLLRSES